MNVGFISLGCSKNLIDTEVAIGKFKEHKYSIVNDPKQADIIVINTCGFIESAKIEAINTILEMAEYKKKRCKCLIVMGCLVQRYYKDLIKSLPEVDMFIKISDYNILWDKISELISCQKDLSQNEKICKKGPSPNEKNLTGATMFAEKEYLAREVSTGENYAYLKIGEGCSNMCTYCAIPYIRGLFVSRPFDDIINEAKMLAKKGIKEIILIAQDTTKYGLDLYGKPRLAELLQELCKIKEFKWIRFLYSYPEGITEELIKVVKENDNICKYFDIPIQHISNDVLKRMNRKTSKENIEKIITKIRKEIPDVILRTSLIVGFPGETKNDFEKLYEFVQKTKFDKLGVFSYSKEDGTPASKMQNQIHYKTKQARLNKIMSLQQEISKEKLEKNIGTTVEVLVENISFDGKYLVGRTKNDVPEEDGIVFIKKTKDNENKLNKFIKCKVIDVNNYDLIAESI